MDSRTGRHSRTSDVREDAALGARTANHYVRAATQSTAYVGSVRTRSACTSSQRRVPCSLTASHPSAVTYIATPPQVPSTTTARPTSSLAFM